MRLPIIAAAAFIIIGLLVDLYIYKAIRRNGGRKTVRTLHACLSAMMLAAIVVTICLPRRSGSDSSLLSIMWVLYTYMSLYVPKILFVITDLISRIPSLFHRNRWKWLSDCGAMAGAIVFAAMWWGALVNRYDIDVNEIEIPVAGLPDSFDGYRIVQFSDLHTGTYGSDTTFVSRLTDLLNSLDGDIIVFTGDIVNRNSDELRPFTEPLSRLTAPDGVYAILGNHDYGDYMDWPTVQAKTDNMQSLYDMYRTTDIDLLLNDHRILRHGSDSIVLIGVENIGDPPFKVYGSLSKAYSTPGDSTVKVLLTHNPAHWTDSIRNNTALNIPLTLSGHTHAMQMSIAGHTPASFRYETPAGLYTDSLGHNLYVNIGIGTVGIPMRLGATPEITVLTLRKQ